jgi:8-oxo-dGTP pyrophosphatase MutT (NUDIX family)
VLHIVFTLRSRNLLSHSGQISFPGGLCEVDETPVQTALRETEEEIGISNNTIEIIGQLTPLFVLPSNSYIFPVVGYSNQFLDIKINHNEVEEAFSKPLSFFSFNNILQRK